MNLSKSNNIFCTTCMHSMGSEAFMVCADCDHFVQCLECFKYGIEKATHLRTHSFVLVESMMPPVFEANWGIMDELFLLEGISKYGYENWEKVADFVGKKDKNECRNHYNNVYLSSEFSPFVDEEKVGVLKSFSDEVDCYYSQEAVQEISTFDKEENDVYFGVNKMRDEFANEYLNDAELLVVGLEFGDNENENSFQKKLELVKCYGDIVKERGDQRKFVTDWELHKNFQICLGAETRKELELDKQLVPFIHVLEKEKLMNLAKVLRDNRRLNEKLLTRKIWKAIGIRTVFEGVYYQKLRALIKNNKIVTYRIDEWNHFIKEYDKLIEKNKNLSKICILNKEEIELCESNNITDEEYFKIKDLLISEYALRGSLSKEESLNLDSLPSEKVGIVYDLLHKLGLIN